MDTLQAILTRRSIRKYLDRPVPEETVQRLLAAHALGLGAVWCGVYPREPRMEGLRRLLGLPENVIAHSLVVLGHPSEQVPPQDRFRAERVRRNHW